MKTFISIRVIHADTKEEAIEKAQDGEFQDNHELCDRVIEIDAAINVLAAYQHDQEGTEKESFFLWKDKSGSGDSNTNIPMINLLVCENEEEETNLDGIPLGEWAVDAEIGDTWENSTDYYTRTA